MLSKDCKTGGKGSLGRYLWPFNLSKFYSLYVLFVHFLGRAPALSSLSTVVSQD